MFKSLLILATLVFFWATTSMADVCDDITKAIDIKVAHPSGTYPLAAGLSDDLPLQITVLDPVVLRQYSNISITVDAVLGLNGAAPIQQNFAVVKNQKLVTLPSALKMTANPAMYGDYKLEFLGTADECLFPVLPQPSFIYRVSNTPDKVDIQPPTLKQIIFRASYPKDQPIDFQVVLFDKSLICAAGVAGVNCPAEVTASIGTGEDLLFVTGTISKLPAANTYEVVLPAQELLDPGDHELEFLSIKDQWLNSSDDELDPNLKAHIKIQ